MDFSDDGDLYQKIVAHQKQDSYFSEEDIWKTLINITLGLKKLHDLNILHRDLKVIHIPCRVQTYSSARAQELNLET